MKDKSKNDIINIRKIKEVEESIILETEYEEAKIDEETKNSEKKESKKDEHIRTCAWKHEKVG